MMIIIINIIMITVCGLAVARLGVRDSESPHVYNVCVYIYIYIYVYTYMCM